jgi:hypothetical protein
MQATRVTFTWEETPELTYDDLMDRLMHLGAEDVETEEFERSEPQPRGERKKKSEV